MIYICYIIYWDNIATCVLAIRDNKLTMGDDNDMLLEVAKGETYVERLREVTQMGLVEEQNM